MQTQKQKRHRQTIAHSSGARSVANSSARYGHNNAFVGPQWLTSLDSSTRRCLTPAPLVVHMKAESEKRTLAGRLIGAFASREQPVAVYFALAFNRTTLILRAHFNRGHLLPEFYFYQQPK